MVSFDIVIHFSMCPEGANTDLLKDTVCYLKLVEIVTQCCQGKRFNLIEFLAKSVYQNIVNTLTSHKHILTSVMVGVHKISPPVPGVHGGVKWIHHVNYGNSL